MLKRWLYTLSFRLARWWSIRHRPVAAVESVLVLGEAPHPATQPGDVPDSFQDYLVIEDVINDLAAKQAWLSAYIDSHRSTLDPTALGRLLALHGQNAARLGRLLRDQRALSGEVVEGLTDAINLALDELSVRFGTPL